MLPTSVPPLPTSPSYLLELDRLAGPHSGHLSEDTKSEKKKVKQTDDFCYMPGKQGGQTGL